MSMSPLLNLALCALGVTPLVAQPTVPLGHPDATFEEPFTLVSGVRELPGGKVLVVDGRERIIQLVDLRSGRASRVGREGSGPGEYRFPSALFALPNDETLLADPAQNRFLRFDVTGKVVETIGYPSGIGPGARPRGIDAAGRVYFEGPSVSGRPDEGIVTADSVPVIRWDRRSGKLDTLLLVKGIQTRVSASGEGNARNFSVRQQPFGSRDGWAVGPDGRVVVARSHPYRVDTRAPTGARTTGAVVSAPALPVTQGEKDAFLKGLQGERRMMTVAGDGRSTGGGSRAAAGAQPPPPSADDFDWPATKPYFDAASVRIDPTGELWSERTRVLGDSVPVYDVFSVDGHLVRRVTFPPRSRLVGFGAGMLYVARNDEDDLQYLERYRVP